MSTLATFLAISWNSVPLAPIGASYNSEGTTISAISEFDFVFFAQTCDPN